MRLPGRRLDTAPHGKRVAKRIGATPRASKASDPAHDRATRSRLHPGAPVRFRSDGGKLFNGVVVKLNRKTARISCDGRMLLVPYGCME